MKTNYKHSNDNAVSPVIGVILMVAITVILAAVIAAFVFGMAGQIQKPKTVAITVQQPDAAHIIATFQGGQDASTLYAIQATLVTAEAIPLTYRGESNGGTVVAGATPGAAFSSVGTTQVPVGTSISFTAVSPATFVGKDHLIVVGVFGDGTQSVILDTFI